MRPGEPFGRYVLTRELGRGGMGVVFAARDPALGREVAIKVVLAPAPPADLLERFRLEAATAARLSHPGVVKVHEAGVERGRPYFVQELVEGESLQARLDRAGPLPPVEAARLVRELALAVEHAHAQGVLHRDLKPANALVTPAGRVCLVDFGLAKDALAGGDLTRTGELLGTLGFMAPEQAGDGAKRVDARADVYGLGATLYALLTGRPPFAGGSPVQVVRRLLEEPPTPPTRERPEVPPALEALVLRCLAKEPGRRPASAADLAAALDRAIAGHHDTPPAPTGGDVALNSPSLEQSVAAALGATVHTPHHD
ncbi:MAG: serine/threonine protein kinase [Planctomycetota bacterium]|nr:serine/threonine protein kinase [Planctomycetota bacterium]